MAPSKYRPIFARTVKKARVLKQKPSWLSAFARFYRKIIPQLLPWRRTKETAKVVVYGNNKIVLLHSLVHLTPMSVALTFIILNGKGHFFGDVSTTTITAIQFAAKLLEILLQASLAAMLYGLIRHLALGNSALPLGTLFAPLNVTNLSYLWSLELWGSLTAKCLGGWRRVVLSIIVPIIVSLAAVVGPSSAVLMVPRQLHHSVKGDMVLLDPEAILFPLHFNASPDAINSYPTLQQSLYQLSVSGTLAQIFSDDVGIRRSLSTTSLPEWTSIPSSRIAKVFQVAYSTLGHALSTVKTRQPLVSADCRHTDLGLHDDPRGTILSFGNGNEPELQNLVSVADIDQQGFSEMLTFGPEDSSNHTTAWLDPPKNVSAKYSVLAVEKLTHAGQNLTYVSACVIRAYWVEASTKYNTSASIVESELTNMPKTTYENGNSNLYWTALGAPIIIAPASASALAQLYSSQPNLSLLNKGYILDVASQFLALGLADAVPEGDICSESLDEVLAGATSPPKVRRQQTGGAFMKYPPQCLTSELSRFVKERKMSRDFDSLISIPMNGTEPEELTQLAVRKYVIGYGYGNGTVPVRLSLVALSLYCLLTTVYLLIMGVTGRTSNSWNSVSELFMLGVNSTMPGHLGKTSVGIETMGTFREPINIRVLDERSVNVIFNSDTNLANRNLRRIVPNEKL